ncbi:transcriptional regulator [Staphylococcus pseudintermedius]|uniref:Transcriptional regulator n=1 Tax=Staphylococcus pseudintermedius TaxID=283734 RepID=A0A8H9EPM7_STAPS|nr:transcriptional regulator [Staphylococcus pseudintermedius]EGQ0318562.1 transcriptional regulator [Staphylococcus pseudintermedius]EGQ1283909.1 transcriptional regulator [Staphylococcus pseudintermedius]EGQ2839698.1 transcriptional regulator [Staphylococcus pseudintermedius]EGQ3464056.1 transcriptional regulator [Staphylococcus pseudintermedius]EGQ4003762.1 transcriptional regulator [Staphylococcus pseudintermedius]
MIKRTINLLVTLALYELGKYVIEQVFILLTANDDVEVFEGYEARREVSD